MFRVSRISTVALTTVAVAALLCACSNTSPSGPGTVVGCLHVRGSYVHVTGDPPQGYRNGAMIEVRYGSDTGPVAWKLDVDINGHSIDFDSLTGLYTGVVPSLAPGDSMTVTVSDGLGAISRTVSVPYAPSNLQLAGGIWDTSGPSVVNRLTWDNPAILGLTVAMQLYAHDGQELSFLYELQGEPTYSDLTLPNSWLGDYETFESVGALVAQKEYVAFPAGHGLAVLSGTVGEWPTSSGGM